MFVHALAYHTVYACPYSQELLILLSKRAQWMNEYNIKLLVCPDCEEVTTFFFCKTDSR
jgi:hypothetical protein